MDLELAGKVALVAGGTRGIGLAIAKGFLAEGANVVVTGRTAASLAAAEAELSGQANGRVLAIQADMQLGQDVSRVLDECGSRYGRLDAVVANVGAGASVPGAVVPREEWQRMLDINLFACVELANATFPRLQKQGSGSFTLISSIAGVEAISAPVGYSAAKTALLMAMKTWARQLAPAGVRVNAVAPGNVLFPGGSWDKKLQERPEFWENYVKSEVPLQRFASPHEIADAVVFLASARASFITGSTLVVDGGQTRSFL